MACNHCIWQIGDTMTTLMSVSEHGDSSMDRRWNITFYNLCHDQCFEKIQHDRLQMTVQHAMFQQAISCILYYSRHDLFKAEIHIRANDAAVRASTFVIVFVDETELWSVQHRENK